MNISTVVKVCLDSNIIISALIFDRRPEEILFMASYEEIKIMISPAILTEVNKVLIKKFKYTEDEAKRLIKSVTYISKIVVPKKKLKVIKYQPDNKILEAAMEGKVDFIVTGDKKHLLPLKEFKGIPIITPEQFLLEIA